MYLFVLKILYLIQRVTSVIYLVRTNASPAPNSFFPHESQYIERSTYIYLFKYVFVSVVANLQFRILISNRNLSGVMGVATGKRWWGGGVEGVGRGWRGRGEGTATPIAGCASTSTFGFLITNTRQRYLFLQTTSQYL